LFKTQTSDLYIAESTQRSLMTEQIPVSYDYQGWCYD